MLSDVEPLEADSLKESRSLDLLGFRLMPPDRSDPSDQTSAAARSTQAARATACTPVWA